MRYRITIRGESPVIQNNGAAGLDTRSPAKLEIAEISRKTGSNRTLADDKRLIELECQNSLWLDPSGTPEIPVGALRSCIESAARKLKQGPLVREGLVVIKSAFDYDRDRYGTTPEDLGKTSAFTVPVVVQKNRIFRTRAMFEGWTCTFIVDCDEELVDGGQLENWLRIGGQRIGLGDWRPAKSGQYGRFEVEAVEPLQD